MTRGKDEGQSAHHRVGPAGKSHEHGDGILDIPGLPQNLLLQDHHGVAGDNEAAPMTFPDFSPLFQGSRRAWVSGSSPGRTSSGMWEGHTSKESPIWARRLARRGEADARMTGGVSVIFPGPGSQVPRSPTPRPSWPRTHRSPPFQEPAPKGAGETARTGESPQGEEPP